VLEPLTSSALLTAATSLGTAFIQIVPEIIKIVSERKKTSQKPISSPLQEERQQLQKDLERLRQEFQREQLQRQQEREAEQPQQDNIRVRDTQEEEIYWQQFNQQKKLEEQLARYNHQTQLEVADYQRKTTLQLEEVKKLFENWPLRIVPLQILEAHYNRQPIPLRIFLSPPTVSFDHCPQPQLGFPALEPKLDQGLREFLDKYYSLQDPSRPTEFLGGAWDSKSASKEASIRALFSMLKSEPTLVLESEVLDEYDLSLRIGYWGLGQAPYCYETITKISYREILCDLAKERALKWKKAKEKLIADGKTPQQLSSLRPDDEANLKLLEDEAELKAHGLDPKDLLLDYKIASQDVQELCQILVVCHCLVAGWVVDAYHYLHYDVPPLLPKLISEITNQVRNPQALQPILQGVVTSYRMLYASLIEERPSWMPELSLQLAKSLAYLPVKSWASEQAYHSVKNWLRSHQLSPVEGIQALDKMKDAITLADRDYLRELKTCFKQLGDQEVSAKLFDLDWEITKKQKAFNKWYQQGVAKAQSGNYREAIDDFNQAIWLDRQSADAYIGRGFVHARLQNYLPAIQDYTHALQLKPDYFEALVNRGNAYDKVGNDAAAVRDYEQALRLNSQHTGVVQALDKVRQRLQQREQPRPNS
jgi:tetratricopeptide (TPR) repeat protein